VRRSCGLLKVDLDDGGAKEIATRARGTPRVANNLINFCRDFAQERAQGRITQPVAAAALELLEIDAAGLDEMDKRMLRVMAENYRGGPVGMSTIAVAVGEEAETLEEVHEPYLIQEGYLQRTPQGRVLTAKGYAAVGLKAAVGGEQGSLL
jgi:Holliday junction DNA helicase RuvB